MATSTKKTSSRKRASSNGKTTSKRASSSSRKTAATRRNVNVDVDRDALRRDIEKQVSAMFKKAGEDPYETANLLNRKKIRTLNGKPFTARRIWFYV